MGISVLRADLPPTFIAWYWRHAGHGERYQPVHAQQLQQSIVRFYKKPHRFVLISDTAVDGVEHFPLWNDCANLVNPSGSFLPSCYRRLKIFAGETTDALGIERGARVISIDLDMLPVDDLVPLFDRPEDFLGWRVPGADHPVVFNGSVFMFRAGAHEHIWEEFDPERSPKMASRAGYHGSDQGWISYCMIGSGWTRGWDSRDGVYGFRAIRYMQDDPPHNARLISFCGQRKHWHEDVLDFNPWIKRYLETVE